MELLIVAFAAGVLTVAAPCILPLLPVIVGGTVIGNGNKVWWRPVVITASLAVSVVVFTLLLKATTLLLGVPQVVWNLLSGGIVLLFGLSFLFPELWERIALRSGLYGQSNRWLQQTAGTPSRYRDVLLGASLGPVFSSCSPTYALVVAIVLPQSFSAGLAYLIAYALGLAAVMLLVAVAGQSLVRRLGWLSNPSGWLRRSVGAVFVIVGVVVLTGFDRTVQAYILEQGWYDPIMKLEQALRLR